jgi:uncharacterized protein (DUF1810 family)
MTDPFELNRFVEAQRAVYARVLSELRTGEKRSHWMWFVFPQIQGLGHSAMARRYAIGSREEAKAYLDHPVLGSRLRECTELVCAVTGKTAHEIFGSPDDLKFRSCMTLFGSVAGAGSVFQQALEKYFSGEKDERTLEKLPSSDARR